MIDVTTFNTISPIDGRYKNITFPLVEYFSDFAYYKFRVFAEIKYLIFFLKIIGKKISQAEEEKLLKVANNFNSQDLKEIYVFEKKTHHDVKAIEYFLQTKIKPINPKFVSFIHFGLTSWDINSIAHGLMIKEGMDKVVNPKINELITKLSEFAIQYKDIPMLGRTHGQVAVPTTFGKEFLVFIARIDGEYKKLNKLSLSAKLSGAVGNFNALYFALPKIDWVRESDRFIKSLGLTPNHNTTQILPAECYVEIFHKLQMINTILIGFNQDTWRYISDDYLKQKIVSGEVGSSTMPQKVNPIDFENSEGNLGVANAILNHFCQKLPISRLQRDLSDSTVMRNIGVALGHCLIGYHSLQKGLQRIVVNENKMHEDLDKHWEVLAEGIQTLLRLQGDTKAYDEMKNSTRGKKLDKEQIKNLLQKLKLSKDIKLKLDNLSPQNYIGLASVLVKKYFSK